MKIFINTSYFLPLIKLAIEGIPDNILQEILSQAQHNLYYSDLTLFEVTAKAFKSIRQDNIITYQDLTIGLDSIQNNSQLTPLSWSNNPLIIELAGKLRKINKDTIDCLIFATAIYYCDCLITLDQDFYNLILKEQSLVKEILSINENFQFWFNDLKKPPLSFKKNEH